MTRHPERVASVVGVEVVYGDFNDARSLAAAFAGVEALHLINHDAAAGTHLRHPGLVVDLAKAAGVRRVTSFRGEPRGRLEAALAQSGLAWTDFSIPVEFMANALKWASSVQAEGLVHAFGPVRSAMIHEDDVGAAIAAALTESGHTGKTYTLTGPEALTPADKVAAIARVLRQPVTLVELTESQARARWRTLDMPESFIDVLVGWHADTPASAYAVTTDLQRIIGRQPRRFEQWVAERAGLFRQVRSAA